MTHWDLIVTLAAALLGAFILGWLAGWLLRPRPGTALDDDPAAGGQAAAGLAEAQAQTAAAREALQQARIEIEELRAYIDRRFGRRDDPEAPVGQVGPNGRDGPDR